MPRHSPYSAHEQTMWADRAALLDPAAYEWVVGANAVCGPVPAGEVWYVVNSWGVISSIDHNVTGTVVSGDQAFTAAGLTGDEGGEFITGPGVAAGRLLLEASAGAGRLNAAATAGATDTYRLFTTDYLRKLRAELESVEVMTPGTTRSTAPFGGYLYVAKPKVVIDADPRYTTDPKALYWSRLATLRTLAVHRLDLKVPPSATVNTVWTKDFPADFVNGLLVKVVCQDGAWFGLNHPTNGAMNTWHEISDYHSIRYAEPVLCPFLRTTFPQIRLAGANLIGNNQMPYGSGYGGGVQPVPALGGCHYFKLPEGW
jgi:hypothetical protein